jgi:Mycolic acid cyclopropane synthetase
MLRLPRPPCWQGRIHQNRLSRNGRGLSTFFPPSLTLTKIIQHVGIRRYSQFLSQIYDLLDDDGIFVLQVAGIRPSWQYEDLIWGLFMNKYIFPGADASCSLGWVINKVCCSLSLLMSKLIGP